jgi:hypothetical protein
MKGYNGAQIHRPAPDGSFKAKAAGLTDEGIAVTQAKTGGRLNTTQIRISLPYEDCLIESLKDRKEAAAYLEAAIEDRDQAVLMLALRHVAPALHMLIATYSGAGVPKIPDILNSPSCSRTTTIRS